MLGGALALWAGVVRAAGTRLDAASRAGGGFGYNGASPGPLLRGRVGAPMNVTLVNSLAEPTSLRLPGGLAGLGRGGGRPRRRRATSASRRRARLRPLRPRRGGGKLWDAGLFGAIVVDEATPPPVDLDAVVVFSGGEPLHANAGAAPLALSAPPGARIRLRLANAAPDLILTLRASDAAAAIVAIDGQPCPSFAPRGGEFPTVRAAASN